MNDTAVTSLKGVGKSLAEKLAGLEIRTVDDLVFLLPGRYQDRTRITPLGELQNGRDVLFCGRIEAASVTYGRRRSLTARVSDDTGWVTIRWFYFNRAQQQQIRRNRWISGFAPVRLGRGGFEMAHPEYRISTKRPEQITSDRLTPVYPLTEGISQARMRALVAQSLQRIDRLADYLDFEGAAPGLPGLHDALRMVHAPPPGADVELLLEGRHPAQKRLALEELLAHHISLRRIRAQRQASRSPSLADGRALSARLAGRLPFELTGAQKRVTREIQKDLGLSQTTRRLMQGDVGCGKTVVAALAVSQCIGASYQAAIMAPTELLAEQHLASFRQWLEPMDIRVEWLSGKIAAGKRKKVLAALARGSSQVVVGTHALFQAGVEFRALGLVVVDEQHRFGVSQRLALIDKARHAGLAPHQIAMTATPIPRTLGMIFYADLDISSIDELPPGRLPIETVLIEDSRRQEVVERVAAACRSGRQAYWVCPLIDESESIQAQAATDRARILSEALPKLRIGLVHGRLGGDEKNTVMGNFRDGRIDVLVATTVIEVGVDVPRASLMIIENAERLGLAQLHQLRGRIGRGEIQSCCVLMYHSPIGDLAKQRLSIMRTTQDGFRIAQRDLEIRGPGDLLGTRQTGLQQFRLASLARDQDLLPHVERIGGTLVKDHPDNAAALVNRWVRRAERFANV